MAGKATVSYGTDIPELDDRDPTTEPSQYLEKIPGTNEFQVIDGRRPSKMLMVNRLRASVDAWRAAGYPGASPTTARLFQWWFEEAKNSTGDFGFYWGQREAVETIAYLVDIEKKTDTAELIRRFGEAVQATLIEDAYVIETTSDGDRIYRRATEAGGAEQHTLPAPDLRRYALKMATGSGKTYVMSLAIVWSYFHHKLEPNSPMSENFLVIAPNVIVFQRLARDFAAGKVFRELPFVPPEWSFTPQVIMRGDSAEPAGGPTIFLTNIQQLYENRSEWSPTNAIDALLGRKPTQAVATQGRSMLDRVRSVDRLMVLNDEAHHVHDEDLKWNQTLVTMHESLAGGLSMWLDLSATPKDQNGWYFPWTIVDYPLAQAVEDRIVKVPVIMHLVDREDPENVTGKNAFDKYGPWLDAAVDRIRKHTKELKPVGAKPVLFVMCEDTGQANSIGEWMCNPTGGRFKDEEVLIIHTDKSGEMKETDLEELRAMARDVDDPDSPVRVVVSVLMLREGWDVRNVTVVVGLRPFTSKADILPEQAVGRGLRLMPSLGPDMTQILEVMGTKAFEDFVRELEKEGLGLPTKKKAPAPPVIVQPIKERHEFDIAIPLTGHRLVPRPRRVKEFDPSTAEPKFTLAEVRDHPENRLRAEHATTEITLGETTIDRGRAPLGTEIVSSITNKVQTTTRLTNEFAQLAPAVRSYMQERCFGEAVDLDDDDIRHFMADVRHQDKVARYLARVLSELIVEEQPIKVEGKPILLSETPKFVWRRAHSDKVRKTVFNYVAAFNDFELTFGEWLDRCKDIDRFAALAEQFTRFHVDYMKPSGALGWYYPDWVAVQSAPAGTVNWIIETKGREWEGTVEKDAAIEKWCAQVSDATAERWRYVRVNQVVFDPQKDAAKFSTFEELVELTEEREAAISARLII